MGWKKEGPMDMGLDTGQGSLHKNASKEELHYRKALVIWIQLQYTLDTIVVPTAGTLLSSYSFSFLGLMRWAAPDMKEQYIDLNGSRHNDIRFGALLPCSFKLNFTHLRALKKRPNFIWLTFKANKKVGESQVIKCLVATDKFKMSASVSRQNQGSAAATEWPSCQTFRRQDQITAYLILWWNIIMIFRP